MVDPALLARLRALLEPRQEILEAYLFGSTARGTAQAHSVRIETRRFGRCPRASPTGFDGGGGGMKGVQFMVDEKGRKTGVVIDLRRNPELWEDLFDRALARERRTDRRETLEDVERRLVKAGKLRSRASA